jgi:hypothetical protein
MAIIKMEPEVELERCPFCGAAASLRGETDFFVHGNQVKKAEGRMYMVWVKCSNSKCGISPAATTTTDEAIKKWNKRAA